MRRLSRHDPEALLRTGQVASSHLLEVILKHHGFVPVPQGTTASSHKRFRNNEFDVNDVGIVLGTDDLVYKKDVAAACKRVSELRQLAAMARPETPQAAFTFASQPALTSMRDFPVPDTIEIVPVEGNQDYVALRSTVYPAVGLIAPAATTEPEARRLHDLLLKKTDDFATYLEMAKTDYELSEIKTEQGSLELINDTYEISMVLPAYDPASPVDAEHTLDNVLAYIQIYDDIFAKPVEQYFDNDDPPPIRKVERTDGQLEWAVDVLNPVTDKTSTFRVIKSPKLRSNPADLLKVFDSVFDSSLGNSSDPKYLATKLHERYGFDVARPRVGKNPGPTLVVTHPFYPACRFEVDAPDTFPSFSKTWQSILEQPDSDSFMLALDRLTQLSEKKNSCTRTVCEGIDIFLLAKSETPGRVRELITKLKALPDIKVEGDKTVTSPGEHYVQTFSHPSFPEPFRLRSIHIREAEITLSASAGSPLGPKFRRKYIVHPDDVQRGERLLQDLAMVPPSRSLPTGEPPKNGRSALPEFGALSNPKSKPLLPPVDYNATFKFDLGLLDKDR